MAINSVCKILQWVILFCKKFFMNKNKKIILTLLGYLISLSLLVITFKDTNFKKVFDFITL